MNAEDGSQKTSQSSIPLVATGRGWYIPGLGARAPSEHFISIVAVSKDERSAKMNLGGISVGEHAFTGHTINGAVAQLVRVLDCRSSGCGFESRRRRLRFLAYPYTI